MKITENGRMAAHFVTTRERWQKIRVELIKNNIEFEPCGYYDGVYITVWANQIEFDLINKILQEV